MECEKCGHTDNSKFMDGHHFYWSDEQNRRILNSNWQFNHDIYRNYCRLADGSIVEYSEAKENNTGSNFDDAVYLGQGRYHHGVKS